jgi:hypothetical protein
MSKGEHTALQLQTQLDVVPKPKELSVTEIAEKVAKARMILLKGIQKQTKKAYKLLDKAMFKRLFSFPLLEEEKVQGFCRRVRLERGKTVAKVRYDILSIIGKHVNLRWMAMGSTFKVFGPYGREMNGVQHDVRIGRRLV